MIWYLIYAIIAMLSMKFFYTMNERADPEDQVGLGRVFSIGVLWPLSWLVFIYAFTHTVKDLKKNGE